jgi:hypothetical protein
MYLGEHVGHFSAEFNIIAFLLSLLSTGASRRCSDTPTHGTHTRHTHGTRREALGEDLFRLAASGTRVPGAGAQHDAGAGAQHGSDLTAGAQHGSALVAGAQHDSGLVAGAQHESGLVAGAQHESAGAQQELPAKKKPRVSRYVWD